MSSYDSTIRDFPSMFSLNGKVVLVTGGSRGLGLSAASGFLQAGAATVYITARKAAGCEAAVAALNALPNLRPGAKAISIPADISKLEGIEYLVREVSKTTDHIDILFANAGATWGAPFDSWPDHAWDRIMNLNVRSVFNCVRLFAPMLQKDATVQDTSRVIITASVGGFTVPPMGDNATFGYTASKAAVIHLAKNLAVQLGPRHILVNTIAPGFFPSKMANGLIEKTGGVEALGKGVPAGRLGLPEDIAGVVVYLASRASAHVNGANITLDGGAHLVRSVAGSNMGEGPEQKAKL